MDQWTTDNGHRFIVEICFSCTLLQLNKCENGSLLEDRINNLLCCGINHHFYQTCWRISQCNITIKRLVLLFSLVQTFNLDIFDHYVTLIGRFDLMYFTFQTFGVCTFLKEVSWDHQGCMYLIKNTVKQKYCELLLKCKITVYLDILKCNYFCDGKAEFSAAIITPAFSFTRFFRNRSNISMLKCL